MQNTRRPIATALLAVLAGALLSLGLGASPAHAAAYTVTIKQYQFGSGALTVQQGDTVTWVNQDEAPHDVVVTSGPTTFRSPMLQKGQRWSFTLSTPGSYSYVCSVHPDMHGALTVKAKPTPAPQPTQAAPTHSMAAAAPPAAKPSTPSGTPGASALQKAHRSATTAPAATAAPAPATAALAPETASGLDPLLLVAGVAVAVVVFCLLLLASRPAGKEN